MKANKYLASLFMAATFLLVPVFADDSTNQTESEESTLESLLNTGKQAWDTVKEKASEIIEDASGAVISVTSKITVGTWKFTNGKHSTTLTCEKDGTMTIAQSTFSGNVTYSGTYTASTNKITFTVTKKQTKILFVTTQDNMNEIWTISYSIPISKEMKVKSDQIPDDANGYDFSKSTIFESTSDK